MRRLPTLCPQTYDGTSMIVTPCTRCVNWKRSGCAVPTGAEHLPDAAAGAIPDCPLADRCQHQLQVDPRPCTVRRKGLVCESALRAGGMIDPENHPLAFHAMVVADAEELAARGVE